MKRPPNGRDYLSRDWEYWWKKGQVLEKKPAYTAKALFNGDQSPYYVASSDYIVGVTHVGQTVIIG